MVTNYFDAYRILLPLYDGINSDGIRYVPKKTSAPIHLIHSLLAAYDPCTITNNIQMY